MNDEQIDEETGEVRSSTELATRGEGLDLDATMAASAGSKFLARLTPEAFNARLEEMELERDRVDQIFKRLLKPDIDYRDFKDKGRKDGEKRSSLLKAGAERICKFLGLVATFHPTKTYGDGVTAPAIDVDTLCRLHLGTADGPVVGEGRGNANSWETRYRYRSAKRACPKCGAEQINRSTFPPKGPDGQPIPGGEPGWYCHRNGGCGSQFTADDPQIVEQVQGRIDNPDPFDLLNTLVKQSEKRAHCGATIRTVGLSSVLSQDLEELAHFEPAEAPDRSAPRPRVADEGAPAREERAAERQRILDGAPAIPEGSGNAHDKVVIALGKRSTEAEVDEWHAAFRAGRAKLSANADNSAFDRRVAWDVEERKRGIRATVAQAAKVKAEADAERARADMEAEAEARAAETETRSDRAARESEEKGDPAAGDPGPEQYPEDEIPF